MKKMKRMLSVLLTLCLAACMVSPAFAAKKYSYTVRLLNGEHGTIKGEKTYTFNYGDQWNPNDADISVKIDDDSMYYFKGFHVAGIEGVETGAFYVTEDTDLVATYGVVGEMVEYTVTYTDSDGNSLHDPQTFKGNIGDKPVIAYIYIDGYRPNAYNLTQTLVKDSTKNVFPFVYTKIPENEAEQPEQPANPENPANSATPSQPTGGNTGNNQTNTTTGGNTGGNTANEGGNVGAVAGNTGNAAGANTAGANAAGANAAGANAAGAGAAAGNPNTNTGAVNNAAGDNATAGTNNNATEDIGDNATPLQPSDTVDLDNNDTPLAGESAVNGEAHSVRKIIGIIAGAVLLIAAGVFAWYMLYFKKKKKAAVDVADINEEAE